MVENKRALQKSDPQKVKEQGDLLSILITDELFANDDAMIVDECMTFFFAGSQTSSANTQNLTMHLLKNTHYGEQISKEVE
jgi:cytochrome P450